MNKLTLLFCVIGLINTFIISVFGQSKVLINEIMVNPNNGNLPKFEYIELFNSGEQSIHLNHLTLSVNNNTVTLPSYILSPKQFVVLSNLDGAKAFEQFGNSLPLPTWYALNNTSATISLKENNETLDLVSYNHTWYNNTNKRNGGWSLERINPNIKCSIKTNWSASLAANGGTPSRPNSILYKNLKPLIEITTSKLLENKIHLTFNIEYAQLTALAKETFLLDDIGTPINILWDSSFDTLILEFDKKIQTNKLYLLQVQEIDICGTRLRINDYPIFHQESSAFNSIVVNEILFNPKEGGVDFVELYNQEVYPVNLKNWKIGNRVIATELLIIQPNDYLALTTDKDNTILHYPSAALDKIHSITSLPSYANQQGNVTILDDQNILIDSVYYNAEMHHSLITNAKGISLERQSFSSPSNEKGNFKSSSTIGDGATPGYRNSIHQEDFNEKKIFFLASKTVSPNEDEFEDFLVINYSNSLDNYFISIDIYNENGKIVKRLIRNKNAGNDFQLNWDCRNETNYIVPPGHYVVLAEIYNDLGDRKMFKEAFIVVPHKLNY